MKQENPERVYAGFWLRILAFVLDSILQMLVLLPILYWYFQQVEFSLSALFKLDVWIYFITLLVIVLFWIFRAATPGKILLRMRIVDASTFAEVSMGQMLIRLFAYVISVLPFGLGFVWIALDKRKQGFHDKLANTLVIVDQELPEHAAA